MDAARSAHRFLLVVLAIASCVASAQAQHGTLAGLVLEDSTRRPIAGAEVSIESLRRRITADENGRFSFGELAAGTYIVTARRLGYRQAGIAAVVVAGEMQERDIVLERTPTTLDTVRVVELSSASKRALALFDEHKKRGFGRFIDSMMLKEREMAYISDVVRQWGSVTMATPPLCRPLGKRRSNCAANSRKKVALSSALCAMQVVVDDAILTRGGLMSDTDPSRDVMHDWDSAFDLASLSVSNILAIEIFRRAGDVPIDYQYSGADCGVIQIWSRR